MTESIPVTSAFATSAWIDSVKYNEMYDRSIRDPDGFWREQGKYLHWVKPYTKVKNASFAGNISIRWFEDGTLNASYNCIDRHLASRGKQTAIIWEGDNPTEHRHITY